MKATKMILICCLAIGSISISNAEKLQVSGRVFDKNTNDALVGVSVCEKGLANGTITNFNGEYTIATEVGKQLEFKYIGYVKKVVTVTSSKLDVFLMEDAKTLDEVVVVGYGTRKMNSVTGAVSSSYRKSYSPRVAGIQVADKKMYNYNHYHAEQDNEEYGQFAENRFLGAKEQPLSTFSLDVDAASYSNIRRMINQGQQPEKDAVRIEELINYFSYNYPQPTNEHPVNIVAESAVCPWNKDHKIVRIGVKAKEIQSENLPATNFVFLLDVSGSMSSPNKLDLVKSSIKMLTNNMRDKDKVAIVVYAGAAGVVLPSTSGSDKQKIMDAVNNLQAGGSTAGGAGIQLAYKIAEKNFMPNGNNRIILCTDGDFNVGVSSNSELETLIESKRKSGIFLTVLGYGMGNYKDSKLQVLAQKGNGNHAYIDNLQEANKVLVNEFGSTMYTVAKDVKIQVEFNPAFVNAYRLIGYESRLLNKEDFNDDTKDAGELGSGHTVTALYEIIPVGVKNTFGGVDDLKYQKNSKAVETSFSNEKSTELLTVKLRYKLPKSNNSEKFEVPVSAKDVKSQPSSDLNFVMAVAMFGQLLRDSDFKGDASYEKVLAYAKKGIGEDQHGYRKEFLRLVESVNQLTN